VSDKKKAKPTKVESQQGVPTTVDMYASVPTPEMPPSAPSLPVQPMSAPMPSAMSGLSSDGTERESSPMAALALILGLVSFMFPPLVLPAFIVSIIALKQTANNKKTGRGMAIAGLVISCFCLLITTLVVILFIVVIRTPLASNNDSLRKNVPVSTLKYAKHIKGSLKVPVVTDTYTLTVAKVQYGYVTPMQYDTPRAGNQFVVVSVDLKNTSELSQYSSRNDFKLRGSDGTEYFDAYVSELPDEFMYTDQKPGATATGNIAFEVPDTLTGWTLIYSPTSTLNAQTEVSL
jgi:hypothetical protein